MKVWRSYFFISLNFLVKCPEAEASSASRGGIFKLLRSPRIDSAILCSLAGRYDNPIPARFLTPIDCYKIRALVPGFRIRIDLMRIRIQNFSNCGSGFWIPDPDPGFDDLKLESDPDPAFFIIADPDPGSGSRVWWPKIEKKLQLEI